MFCNSHKVLIKFNKGSYNEAIQRFSTKSGQLFWALFDVGEIWSVAFISKMLFRLLIRIIARHFKWANEDGVVDNILLPYLMWTKLEGHEVVHLVMEQIQKYEFCMTEDKTPNSKTVDHIRKRRNTYDGKSIYWVKLKRSGTSVRNNFTRPV